jgi:hypothetical protein
MEGIQCEQRSKVMVIEACSRRRCTDSPKELDSLLLERPFWGIVKTKVPPLQNFEYRRDRDRQSAEQLEGGPQQQ